MAYFFLFLISMSQKMQKNVYSDGGGLSVVGSVLLCLPCYVTSTTWRWGQSIKKCQCQLNLM